MRALSRAVSLLVFASALAVAALAGAQNAPASDSSAATRVARTGAAEPRVVLLLFADLDSAPSMHASNVLRGLLERYPDTVAVEFHYRPADGQVHPAEAAVMAASAQQRGWEMAELLMANQDRRHGRDFTGMARQLQLDRDLFAGVMADEAAVRDAVERDLAEAQRLLLPKGAATIVVDGQVVKPTLREIEAAFAELLGPAK